MAADEHGAEDERIAEWGDFERAAAPPRGLVLRRGELLSLGMPAELLLEDGAVLGIIDVVPLDLPTGRHALRFVDGEQSLPLLVIE